MGQMMLIKKKVGEVKDAATGPVLECVSREEQVLFFSLFIVFFYVVVVFAVVVVTVVVVVSVLYRCYHYYIL